MLQLSGFKVYVQGGNIAGWVKEWRHLYPYGRPGMVAASQTKGSGLFLCWGTSEVVIKINICGFVVTTEIIVFLVAYFGGLGNPPTLQTACGPFTDFLTSDTCCT